MTQTHQQKRITEKTKDKEKIDSNVKIAKLKENKDKRDAEIDAILDDIAEILPQDERAAQNFVVSYVQRGGQ